jgi:hypothetical protein
VKEKIDTYFFDASAKTVKFLDYDSIDLERILLITNVTDNIIIYNFADSTKGGTVAMNVLTLTYDTTSMDDSDKLLIFYEEDVDSTVIEEAGETKTLTSDRHIKEILSEILTELKIMNVQFEVLTETQIEQGDIQ